MKFCPVCDNMYYICLADKDSNSLVYYCRYCENRDETLNDDNICVLHTNLKKKEQKFHNFINEYTKLDPTLPRLNNMKCPNTECPTNTSDAKNEIIYIRYDDTQMKYIYLCTQCEQVWKSSDKM